MMHQVRQNRRTELARSIFGADVLITDYPTARSLAKGE
jgi:hypothetical protein